MYNLYHQKKDKFNEFISPTKGYLRETCKSQSINRVFPNFCISGVLGTPICCFLESLDKFQESHVALKQNVI